MAEYHCRYTKYIRGVNTSYTKQYAVFSGGRCCLYKAIRSIFGESMLLILSNTTQYYWGVDTAYTKQYAVLSGGRYCVHKAINIIFGELINSIRLIDRDPTPLAVQSVPIKAHRSRKSILVPKIPLGGGRSRLPKFSQS